VLSNLRRDVFPTQRNLLLWAQRRVNKMAPLKVPLIDGQFPNYYHLLEIQQTASEQEIRSAYRKKALSDHPDKTGGGQEQNEAFSHINIGKTILLDPDQRKQYDVLLEQELAFRNQTFNRPTPSVPTNTGYSASSFARAHTSTHHYSPNYNPNS
jgi:DnaJ-class molecular chaperone